jgi:hypothetical protein
MSNSIVPKLNGKDEIVVANHPLGTIELIRKGAYVNLNDLAALYGKRVDSWMRLKGTKDLLAGFKTDPAYKYQTAIFAIKGNQSNTSHVWVKTQKLGGKGVTRSGTWAHPDIAIVFAQWCNPMFALWVARQIRHLLSHGEVNLHHQEWTADQVTCGLEYNRDDIKDLYGR